MTYEHPYEAYKRIKGYTKKITEEQSKTFNSAAEKTESRNKVLVNKCFIRMARDKLFKIGK